LVALHAGPALGQVVVQSEIVVPRRSVFTLGTSISVPDRGEAALGGVRSSSDLRSEFRPGWGRGIARSAMAQDASVRVEISDVREIDDMLGLNGAQAEAGPTGFAASLRQYASGASRTVEVLRDEESGAVSAEAQATSAVRRARALQGQGQLVEAAREWRAALDRYGSAIDRGEAIQALAQLREQPEVAESLAETRAAAWLERGRAAEADGKLRMARTYYQSASRLNSTPSARSAAERLAAIERALGSRAAPR
jgi:tetratricopeptide (TPR) repeat protein